LKTLKIPEATIIRLSVYSRHLTEVDRKGIITTSSGDIAEGVGVSPAQVRKDLAYFGEFGTRGVGYNVKDLRQHILRILGLSVDWSVCLVGAGNLGLALSTYKGFRESQKSGNYDWKSGSAPYRATKRGRQTKPHTDWDCGRACISRARNR